MRHVLGGAGPRTFPAEEGARAHLDQLLDQAVSEWQYTAGAIADASGEVVMVQGSRLAGLREKAATLSEGVDILGSASAPVYVLFVAAVKATADGEPLGVVVLAVDPERFLFPLLRREPVPSATGETLLALREGEEVVFLNTARFHPGGPLSLRRPIDSPRFDMGHALAGDEAFGEFLDYRGARVVASTRRVSTAPWGLVVKVDAAEAYALERRHFVLEIAMLLFVLAAFGGLAYALRKRE